MFSSGIARENCMGTGVSNPFHSVRYSKSRLNTNRESRESEVHLRDDTECSTHT